MQVTSCKGDQVPGSRGSFKQASIVTMEVLRDNRSSLLAMLEAFLYDPLLSWTVSAARTPTRIHHVCGYSTEHSCTRTEHSLLTTRRPTALRQKLRSQVVCSSTSRTNSPNLHQSYAVCLTFAATAPKPANSTNANVTDAADTDAPRPTRPTTTHVVPQSIAPPLGGSNSDVLNRIDNSLVHFIAGDSYTAKVSGSGMTNSKALAVLAGIERKLAGESMCPPKAHRRYPGVRVQYEYRLDANAVRLHADAKQGTTSRPRHR